MHFWACSSTINTFRKDSGRVSPEKRSLARTKSEIQRHRQWWVRRKPVANQVNWFNIMRAAAAMHYNCAAWTECVRRAFDSPQKCEHKFPMQSIWSYFPHLNWHAKNELNLNQILQSFNDGMLFGATISAVPFRNFPHLCWPIFRNHGLILSLTISNTHVMRVKCLVWM